MADRGSASPYRSSSGPDLFLSGRGHEERVRQEYKAEEKDGREGSAGEKKKIAEERRTCKW